MTQKIILGIDEVGRGPWAGPLLVGAVILGEKFHDFPRLKSLITSGSSLEELVPDQNLQNRYLAWSNFKDSKQLSPQKRQQLSQIIKTEAVAYALGQASAAEIDQYGLSPALKLATRRAVEKILAQKAHFDEIIIDGTINLLDNTELSDRVILMKKADNLVKEVSAASIIAKVARDEYMIELGTRYPGYGFEHHVGYGTTAHKTALETLGICPEHRKSFRPIREIIAKTAKNAQNCPLECPSQRQKSQPPSHSAQGKKAEEAVARYLQDQNHKIIAHNFKAKTYEIDLISVSNQTLFFTEVKYSEKPLADDTPLSRIDPRKQRQMRYAANCFLATHPPYQQYTPLLAAASVSGPQMRVDDWLPIED